MKVNIIFCFICHRGTGLGKSINWFLETHSITEPAEKLKKAIHIVTRTTQKDSLFTHINEVVLNRIMINENSKSFLTKEVDKENQDGFFTVYKRMVTRLKEMIQAVDEAYEFPTSLAGTILEGGLHQHFLKDHFKSITDCNNHEDPSSFFTHLTFTLLKKL